MSFAEHLLGKITRTTRIVENSVQDMILAARAQIENKVGGKIEDETAKQTSFEAIETALDLISLELLDSNREAVRKLFDLFIIEDKLDFIESFTKYSKDNSETLLSDMNELNRDQDIQKFIVTFSKYSKLSERLLKIYKILSSEEIESISEAIQVKPEIKQKIAEILKVSKEATVNGFIRFNKQEADSILDIEEDEDTEAKQERRMELLNSLGVQEYINDELDRRGKSIKSSGKESTQYSRIKNKNTSRLIDALDVARLPNISNSEISAPGDYYRLFKRLEKENSEWINRGLEVYVIGAQNAARRSEFETRARNNESIYEEDQITYLNAVKSWIIEYIKNEKDGVLAEKTETNLRTRLENTVSTKEKEIKNYYLSRDFNLGNFGGIQLKPEIDLPLYQKVELAVSEKDRIRESPLRNILKSLGTVITSLAGAIPYKENPETVRVSAARNIAIMNAINSLARGAVSAVGGKQAAREYDKTLTKVFGDRDKKKVTEDAVASTTSASVSSPGQDFQTPNAMITGGMDTFSLAGPGKKKRVKSTGNALSFSEFMKKGKV